MPEFARITNGVYIQTTAPEYPASWPAGDQVPVRAGPWQEWDGEKWVGDPPAPEPEPLPPLSPRQIRLALNSIGISEQDVDTALADDEAAMIEWKWATQFERDHPLVVDLIQYFDLDPATVDGLWEMAANY